MKWIKFTLTTGDITLSEDQAKRVLDAPTKQVMINDDFTGEWTGDTINKAFLIKTEPVGEVTEAELLRARMCQAEREEDTKLLEKLTPLYESKRKQIGNTGK